jgi:hypothetical protein
VDLGELVALLGEPPNVILKGLARLMSTTLHIPRVAWPRVCALEVASEDLLEIIPAINQISGQVIEPGPDCVSQVNREKLDDEDVVIHPTHPARKAVIFQPNAGVGFAIIIDDVVWLLEIFWETCIMHVAPKHLGPWPLGAEAAPLDRYAHRNMGYVRGARNAPPPLIPSVSLMACRRLGWPGWRQVKTCADEEVVPTAGSCIVVLCRLTLEQPGLEMETSARHWSEFSTCCVVVTSRTFFS